VATIDWFRNHGPLFFYVNGIERIILKNMYQKKALINFTLAGLPPALP